MKPPMKSNLKKIRDCRYALSVEIDPREVNACFEETFLEIQKRAKVPGFRQGKAPVDVALNGLNWAPPSGAMLLSHASA